MKQYNFTQRGGVSRACRLLNFKSLIVGLFFTLFATSSSMAQNCVVNAGILNETICENSVLNLIGNDPMPRIGDVVWTQIAGPSVVIDDPNASVTTVSGYTGGNTYMFRFSALCGDGVEAFQDKTVFVEPITIADAGMDIEFCPDVAGNVTITGNTPQPNETGTWIFISGSNDAGVVIPPGNENSPTTTIDMPPTSCGITTLGWEIRREYAPGQFCVSVSQIDVTNFGGVSPVDAGFDQVLGNCYTTTQSTDLDATFGGCSLNGQVGFIP